MFAQVATQPERWSGRPGGSGPLGVGGCWAGGGRVWQLTEATQGQGGRQLAGQQLMSQATIVESNKPLQRRGRLVVANAALAAYQQAGASEDGLGIQQDHVRDPADVANLLLAELDPSVEDTSSGGLSV